MSDTSLPGIPDFEYPIRWKKIQTLMEEKDIDLFLAYGDDHAVYGPAHIRWLADFPVHFEPAIFLLSRQGDPILICGPESPGYAAQTSRTKNFRIMREFTHPDEDYAFSKIEDFVDIAAQCAGSLEKVRRIGIAGKGIMGHTTFESLRAAMKDREWVDIDYDICRLRSIKTPAELAVIRHAYKIAEDALMAGINMVDVGVSERDLNAEIDYHLWKNGGEGPGIATTITSGKESSAILGRSTFKKFKGDELVMITVAPRYEGYHAAIGRCVFIGNPGPEAAKAREAVAKASDAAFKMMRPGVEGSRVEGAGRQVMMDAGFGKYFPYSGVHSIGVIEFEPPIFGPSAPGLVEENMVLSIDIPVFHTPWGGLRVEDGFVVTASGAERLNNTAWIFDK